MSQFRSKFNGVNLRREAEKAFIERWKNHYPEARLHFLAKRFANVEIRGFTYPPVVMEELAWLAKRTPRHQPYHQLYQPYLQTGFNLQHKNFKTEQTPSIYEDTARTTPPIHVNDETQLANDNPQPTNVKTQQVNGDIDVIIINVPFETISLIDEDSFEVTPVGTECSAPDTESTSELSNAPVTENSPCANTESSAQVTDNTPENSSQVSTAPNSECTNRPAKTSRRQRRTRGLINMDPIELVGGTAAPLTTVPIIGPNPLNTAQNTRKGRKRQNRAIQQEATNRKRNETAIYAAPPAPTISPVVINDTIKIDLTKTDQGTSTKGAVSPLRVAITTDPPTNLTRNHADLLKNIITEKLVLAAHESNYVPAFRGKPFINDGALRMWCEDENALLWLRKTLAELSAPNQGRYVVVSQENLDIRVTAGVLLPSHTISDASMALRMLCHQNTWENVLNWKVYSARVQQRGLFLVLGIPMADIPQLLSTERRMSYLMGSIYIRFFVDGRLSETPPRFVTNMIGS